MENEKKKSKKRRILLLLLLLLLLFLFSVTVFAMFFEKSGKSSSKLTPDKAPKTSEISAEPIGDDNSSKLSAPNGGGAVSLTYSKAVRIDLSDKKVALLFANPSKSTHDVVLQLVIKDTVVMKSGTLSPGNKVTKLDLLKGTENLLQAGEYESKFVVSYFDRQSGEAAKVNTEIPVTVTVAD